MARRDALPPGFDINRAERLHFILEMKKSGASNRAIAAHLKKLATDGDEQGNKVPECWAIGHVQVGKEIKAALTELNKENQMSAQLLKRLLIERLEAQLLAIWPAVINPRLADYNAHWVALAICKRYADLEGLNAAILHEVKVKKDPRAALAAILGVPPDQLPVPDGNEK